MNALITMGDACGIGPEIIIAAVQQQPELTNLVTVVGDKSVMERAAGIYGTNLSRLQLSVVQAGNPATLSDLPFGSVHARAGQAAFDAIKKSVEMIRTGAANTLITAPISKQALQLAGHRYPGHTELLAELATLPNAPAQVRMMLANDELRTILVSIHVSLRQSLDFITEDNIVETITIAADGLRLKGIAHPRLAVAGLNPHAGEGGILGREEIDIIEPAITRAKANGIHVQGPFPPDTIFMRARGFEEFDAVIAMYHDQGLIPVKYLGIEQGVNITLGLPFVRSSPDHGTAFDIAGKGIANPSSLIAAIRYALEKPINIDE
jgi:4-hydroxythreonine-4-phosphate dehydrogenase